MINITIEIWSDVVCPFCYIGKRKLETALAGFEKKDAVRVIYRSFQLSPETVTDPQLSLHEYLAKLKGVSEEEARSMNRYVAQTAEKAGLRFNFDKAVPANTFRAHQVIHFAKERGGEEEITELLFKSYFTEGKNIDDEAVLLDLAESCGLDKMELAQALHAGKYSASVKQDLEEAAKAGIKGVPFFLFNRKYAVSGAQEAPVFAKALNMAFGE